MKTHEKRVVIHQPDFIPWLGFFHRWNRCDHLVLLDDVQFNRRGWTHRDQIKCKNGLCWLTVPVKKKDRYEQQIRDVEIDYGSNWRNKHLKTIELNYRNTPGFNEYHQLIKGIYEKTYHRLIDLNCAFLEKLAAKLKITTPTSFSSAYGVSSMSTQRLIDLLVHLGADTYLTGTGSRAYIDERLFANAGVQLQWQDYIVPEYPQLHGPFEPIVSVIDYLMMGNETMPN